MPDRAVSNNKVQDQLKSGPMSHAVIPVLSDTIDLAVDGRGLYVGVAGDVKVTLISGQDVLFDTLSQGVIHAIEVRRVWATGTAATDLLVLW